MRTFTQANKIANKILTMLDNYQAHKIPAYISNKQNIQFKRLNKFFNIKKSERYRPYPNFVELWFNYLGDTYRIDIEYR